MNQRLLSYIILKQHVEKVADEIGIDATMDIIYRVVTELDQDQHNKGMALARQLAQTGIKEIEQKGA
jgi:hypothetical protein